MPEVYGFDAAHIQRIANAVRLVEGSQLARNRDLYGVPNWQHVRITGEAVGDGSGSGSEGSGSDTGDGDFRYWPGVIEVWDANANEAIVLAEVWVLDRNDYDLEVGSYYTVRESGPKRVDWNTRPLFIHGEGLSYPRADDGSGGVGSGCGGGSGRSRTITIQGTTCVDGHPCTTTTTITSPLPFDVCVSTPDCGSGG